MIYLSVKLCIVLLSVCICFTNAFPYEMYSPFYRAPIVRMIPIKPMNCSTIRHASHRLPPINPLAEEILVPDNLHRRYRPEQIMERLTESASNQNTRRHKDKINLFNLEAFTLKPAKLNYNTVLATLTPETERIFKILNRTDAKNNPKMHYKR